MPGPRRSKSVTSYIWETRAIAAVAVAALIASVVGDTTEGSFWSRHALLTGLASSLIVVMLTVALFNEALERRRRRRWSVLAQYVMLQLVRDARGFWTGLLELAELMPIGALSADEIEDGAKTVRDTGQLTGAVRGVLADPHRRRYLHESISRIVVHNDEVLGRWAGVMLNTDLYAEVIDRHVELAGDLAWLGSLLDSLDPGEVGDPRGRASRNHPAVQVTGLIDDEQLADRIVTITQLAEELDRGTLELALRLVPIEWWAARLGTSAPGFDGDSPAPEP